MSSKAQLQKAVAGEQSGDLAGRSGGRRGAAVEAP